MQTFVGHAVSKQSYLQRTQSCEGQTETFPQEALLWTPGHDTDIMAWG